MLVYLEALCDRAEEAPSAELAAASLVPKLSRADYYSNPSIASLINSPGGLFQRHHSHYSVMVLAGISLTHLMDSSREVSY